MITDLNQQELINKVDDLIKLMTGCKPISKEREDGTLEVTIGYVDKFILTKPKIAAEVPERIKIFALSSARLLLLEKVIELMKDPKNYVVWCKMQQLYLQTQN